MSITLRTVGASVAGDMGKGLRITISHSLLNDLDTLALPWLSFSRM